MLPEEGPPGSIRTHVTLMVRLLHRLAKGDYALTVSRQGQTPEIHCAFDQEVDLERIAEGVAAETVSRVTGWASVRIFEWNRAASDMIRDALDQV